MIYYAWSSDLSKNSGEGKLGLMFIENIYNFTKKNIHCFSNNGNFVFSKKTKNTFKDNKLNNNFYNNYVKIFYGIFLMWKYYFLKKKIIYVNYLPIWNFLIFLLLPPKTILGPITGNLKKNRKIFGIIKIDYILYLCSLISLLILKVNKKNFFFAHEDLYKKLKKNLWFDCFYNYQLLYFKKSKKNLSKKNNILIYNRSNKSKNIKFLLSNLFKKKFFDEIGVVGLKLSLNSVKNYGYVNHKKLLKILSKYKFALISDENIYSFFCLDALSCQVRLIYNKNSHKFKNYFNNSQFIKLDKLNSKNISKKNKKIFLKRKIEKILRFKLNIYLKNALT
jgi:hypothetical protein